MLIQQQKIFKKNQKSRQQYIIRMGTQVCSTCQTHPSALTPIITRQFQGQAKKYITQLREKHKHDIQNNSKQHILPNGHMYKGEISGGKKQGYGQYYAGPQHAYFGQFKQDKPHGQGIMISKSNNYLKSTFVNGVAQGESHQKVNRNYFHGHLMAGMKTKGVLTTDQYKYQGTFNTKSQFQGYGVLQFQNGDRYDGDFKDGLYHGDGTYTTRDGETYRGQWKLGKYDGVGVFKWSNNRWYDGEYREGIRNGWGTMVDAENGTWQGLWVNGQLQNGKQSANLKHQNNDHNKAGQKVKQINMKRGIPDKASKLTESTSHNDLAGYTIELF